jgi:D-serine deaminase-like pyridoxal phosphate-dependent protein
MSVNVVGKSKWELETPALCLDAGLLKGNITRMADYLRPRAARLRPHSKTHKCPTIAWMQLEAGAIGITCAKLSEAEVMAQAGVRDILIANQIVGEDKIARLINLAAYSEVMVAVDSVTNASELSAAAQAKGVRLRVLIEVDTGMHRCGTAPGQASLDLARQIVALPGLRFEGIMGYEGHAVMIGDLNERRQVTEASLAQLVGTRDTIASAGIPVGIVSAGGSGTHMITANYAWITEIQAGSYATMDCKYKEVGLDFALALTVVARVISVTGSDRAIIDAGLKALTTEFGTPRLLKPAGWSLVKLSEEHGELRRDGGSPLHPGDRVEIVPTHGCTTINLHDAYHVTRRDVLEAVWPIAGRGHVW